MAQVANIVIGLAFVCRYAAIGVVAALLSAFGLTARAGDVHEGVILPVSRALCDDMHKHNVIRTGEGAAPKLHAGKRARGGGIHIKKSHQGLLHKNLGVAADKPIPAKKLSKALHSSDPAVKKRAVFAENAKHWHH